MLRMGRKAAPFPPRSTALHPRHLINRLIQPVLKPVPVLAEQLHRMHGPIRPIATGQCLGWAIEVAAPADALGVAGVGGEFFGHGVQSSQVGAEFTLCGLVVWVLIEIKVGLGLAVGLSHYRFSDGTNKKSHLSVSLF